MPTKEELRIWAEQVATAAAPFGEAAAVASGTPAITCAYLINLLNGLLRQIAQDTAISGMTAKEAQAYKDLQVLRSRIVQACDETPTLEEPEEETPEDAGKPEPEEPLSEEPQPGQPQSVQPTQSEGPAAPEPSCCDIHGHQLPSLDFRSLTLRVKSGGVVIGGTVVSEHPCGFAYWDMKVVMVGPNGAQTQVYRNMSRVGSSSKQLSLSLPSSFLRGFRSGFVEITVESLCGTSNRAIRSNHGWVIKPDSPTHP